MRRSLALLAAMALLATSCGGTEEVIEPLPGSGVTVALARANWSTGYFQAELYRQLLGELGYEVSDPSDAEMGPRDFYQALAKGEFDFWVNGWIPTHDRFLEEVVAGAESSSRVRSHISIVGNQLPAGAMQGFYADIATVDRLGIKTIDDIAGNPEAVAAFDRDGDGRADLIGCNNGWGCQLIIDDTIGSNRWRDTIHQVSGDYETLWDDTVARYQAGEPILTYTWSPSAYIAQLVAGTDVYWLGVEEPLRDQVGASPLPASLCPHQPCEMGFAVADIRVVANTQFLDENPAAARLLEVVNITLFDIASQNVMMANGENSEDDIQQHAADWIADNRGIVEAWLKAARESV